MAIEFFGKTHIGTRALNEDRLVADSGWGIALVSDGMGGHAGGEIAAGIVAEGVVDRLDQGMALEQAVADTHEEVVRAALDGRGKTGMGATLVVAHFDGHDFELTWIGDSRAYLWNGELRQITRDHSEVEQALARGEITAEAARHAPNKNVITRAMGLDHLTLSEVSAIHGTLCRGEALLLCSDGLSDVLTGVEIAGIVASDTQPEDKLDALVGQALAAGGSDNITAVLAVADDQAPEPETSAAIPAVALARADGFSQYFPPDDA